MSKETKAKAEVKRRLKKMQKHVDALRPLSQTADDADDLDTIEGSLIRIEERELKPKELANDSQSRVG